MDNVETKAEFSVYEASAMKEDDDVSAFLGKDLRLNKEQVMVCREGDTVVGCVIIWDGGHSIVSVDHLVIKETDGYKKAKITHALLSAAVKYIKDRGAEYMIFIAGDIEIAYLAKKRGAAVIGPMHRMLFKV